MKNVIKKIKLFILERKIESTGDKIINYNSLGLYKPFVKWKNKQVKLIEKYKEIS